jgi:hypothetical protein
VLMNFPPVKLLRFFSSSRALRLHGELLVECALNKTRLVLGPLTECVFGETR